MKKQFIKSLMIAAAFSMVATSSAYADAGRLKQCRTDVSEMRAEIAKWHGPVHALNESIQSIAKGRYKYKAGKCSHICNTWDQGDGTCTWNRGSWTDSLWFTASK